MLIEYEGTNYSGFQIQNDVPTIQGEIERAIKKVTGEEVRLKGAGRTDAGVHARGQVAAFDTEARLLPMTIVKALNHYLPLDIAIRNAGFVRTEFDPRRDAVSREYRYTVYNHPARSPLSRTWAFNVLKQLNIDTMNAACEILIGERDFAPFTNAEGAGRNTIRTVSKAEFRRYGELVFFEMKARAFLYQQVRRSVGSLLRVGLGKMDIEEFHEIARSGEIGKAKQVAPPHGLCLMKVNYSDIGFDHENL